MMKTRPSENLKNGKMPEMPVQKAGLAEFLKEKRQKKNLTLEQLSDLTKIQIYHLKALEAGQFEKLPPAVYCVGIFKRLSKFLDADENEIMEVYRNKIEFSTSTKTSNTPIAKKQFYFILTPSKLMMFSGGLLLIILSGYLWYQFNFLIGPPNLTIKPSEDAVTKEETILINGKTDNGINLTINGENTYVDSKGSFEKSVQLAAGVNVIEIKAVNNFGKVSTIIRQIFKETQ
ncbi:MAG: helix-turn-helix domain-containing protein [Parcubacteria group bacterium]|nr:helix-turn-helix domain-containing protein [Parcubacteria group bacterium]